MGLPTHTSVRAQDAQVFLPIYAIGICLYGFTLDHNWIPPRTSCIVFGFVQESMEELKQEVVVGLDAEWKPGSPPQHGADLLQVRTNIL